MALGLKTLSLTDLISYSLWVQECVVVDQDYGLQ